MILVTILLVEPVARLHDAPKSAVSNQVGYDISCRLFNNCLVNTNICIYNFY